MTNLLWIFLILIVFTAAILGFILIQEVQKPRKLQQQIKKHVSPRKTTKSSQLPQKIASQPPQKIASQPPQKIGREPSHLQKKLLRMVGGNQDTAQRLIYNIRIKNPGQTEVWYWEKVIFDLERDRH